jgi:hypothetical protein
MPRRDGTGPVGQGPRDGRGGGKGPRRGIRRGAGTRPGIRRTGTGKKTGGRKGGC